MRFFWMLIIWHIASAENNDSPKDFLYPTDSEDNAFLWKNLFIKLNTVLSETEKLGQSLTDVNKRLDDLTKRQNDHESRLTKLMENVNDIRVDSSKRNEDQDRRLTQLLNNVNASHIDNQMSQWTAILRRQDGYVNFNRNWEEYKNGFGNPNADFFIGLEMLHALTTNGRPQELQIILIDFDGETRYAKYNLFRIGSENEKYAIKELGTYSGDAGDGMAWHRGRKFSTHDRDNNAGNIRNCPDEFKGGWWFHDPCYSGHLHGPYRQENSANTWGVSWHPWRKWDHSLKYAAMMIRPKL